MGGWDCPHHMSPWPPEDNVVGRFDVKDAELRDNVVWIRSDGERDCSLRARLALVKSKEKRLGLRENHLSSQLESVLYLI